MADLLAAANLISGVSFLVVPSCIVWLFLHRRKDWPKAWVMLLAGSAMGTSGLSRLCHAADYADLKPPTDLILVLDLLTASVALTASAFIPRAVVSISRFPTPREVEHAIRGNMARHAALREVERAKAEAVRLRQHRAVLLYVINMVPDLPPGLKNQIDELIAESDVTGAKADDPCK